jgi:prevent-host-death family protein
MIRVIPAARAKNNFGEVLRRVSEQNETQIVERAGLPVAAIVSIEDLERLYPERVKALPRLEVNLKRKRAVKRLVALINQPGSKAYSEDEVDRDVQREVEAVRYGKRKT